MRGGLRGTLPICDVHEAVERAAAEMGRHKPAGDERDSPSPAVKRLALATPEPAENASVKKGCGQSWSEQGRAVASRVIVRWAVDIAVGVRAEGPVEITEAARPLAVAAVVGCQHQESAVPHLLLP